MENKSNELIEKKCVQGISVVWFDPKNNDQLERKARLRSLANYLKLFDDIDLFTDYLFSIECSQKKLYVILPGSYGKTIVPFLHDQTQAEFIYIFCKEKERHEEWIKLYSPKIRGIFIDKHELVAKLTEDVEFYTKMTPMSVISANQLKPETSVYNLNKEEASFMWHQLLIEILRRMPLTTVSRKDLLKEIRREYEKDIIELRKIQEFEDTYDAENVIEWYTRDAFLYRLLNKALRTRDISIIFQFRFVLVDLENCLAILHAEYIRSLTETETLTVYRGQGLSVAELNQLKDNINGRISMNSFVSTSTSSVVALNFAGNGSGRPLIESVLFEIQCPLKLSTKPFSNIQHKSYSKAENEILFTIGTVFRIDAVENLTDDIWLVQLFLCDNETNSVRDELINSLKSDIDDEADILTLAKFLFDMNNLDKAEQFYNSILCELPADHSDVIVVKNDLGGILRERGEYIQALRTHKEALKLCRSTMPHDFVVLSATYNDIGFVYSDMNYYLQALKCYRKALQIRRKHQPQFKTHIAITYNHLGTVYNQMGKKKLALKYYEKALVIRKRYYPETHPKLANMYNNIGEVYLSMQNIEAARTYLERGLAIRLHVLPGDHRDLAISYSNMGQVHDYSGDNNEGLECHQKALNILLKFLPSNHIDLAAAYNNIGECFSELGDFTSALLNHKKALQIRHQLSSTPRVEAEIIISYCNIGVLFEDQNKYCVALKYFRKALTLASASTTDGKLFSKIYYDIATVYHHKEKEGMALKYYRKALDLELKCDKPDSSLDLARIYFGLGQIYEDRGDCTNALTQFERSLAIRRKCLKSNHSLIEETLSNMALVSSKLDECEKALAYLSEALDLQLQSDSIYLASTCISIGSIHHHKQDYKNALLYYKKALNHSTQDNPDLGSLYYQIGLIYDEKSDCDSALENYQNALNFLSIVDSITVDIYNRIGCIYHTNVTIRNHSPIIKRRWRLKSNTKIMHLQTTIILHRSMMTNWSLKEP